MPFVRARYGWQARGCTSQSRQNAAVRGVEDYGLRLAVSAEHEAACVVAEHLERHAAEVPERRRDPVEPFALPLVEERLHEHPSRVAQHRGHEVHCDLLAGDPDPPLAEVDLHLPAWRRLEPHRRNLRRVQVAATACDNPLHGADAGLDAALGEELSDDDSVPLGLVLQQLYRLGASRIVEAPRRRALLDLVRWPAAHDPGRELRLKQKRKAGLLGRSEKVN